MNNCTVTELLTSADFKLEIKLQLFVHKAENFLKSDLTASIISQSISMFEQF
jgi:hypothetical protein